LSITAKNHYKSIQNRQNNTFLALILYIYLLNGKTNSQNRKDITMSNNKQSSVEWEQYYNQEYETKK
jgi:hypothetical protein